MTDSLPLPLPLGPPFGVVVEFDGVVDPAPLPPLPLGVVADFGGETEPRPATASVAGVVAE